MTAEAAYPPVILTVDCVLLTLADGRLSVALQKRPNEPFAGVMALPGGYVHADKDADLADTARRVLADKLGLDARRFFLEQLETVSGPNRDPRGWAASVVYYALANAAELGSAREVQLFAVDALPALAFDHAKIIDRAVERLRAKTAYSNLPGFLLPPTFTLPELQEVYERVLGQKIDQSVFRKRMDEAKLIEPAPEGFRTGGRHRPAQLYRMRDQTAALQDRTMVQRSRRG